MMVSDLGHARLVGRPTVHVVRSISGPAGVILASLCGAAAAPLEGWAERTWTTIEGRTRPCAACEPLAARRKTVA